MVSRQFYRRRNILSGDNARLLGDGLSNLDRGPVGWDRELHSSFPNVLRVYRILFRLEAYYWGH